MTTASAGCAFGQRKNLSGRAQTASGCGYAQPTLAAAAPARYTLTLRADGRAEMLFDCNRGSSSYEIEGNKLTFGPMISTRMACPNDTQDAIYMEYLKRATSFFMRDDALYLELPVDSGTMEFRQAGMIADD